MSLCALVFTGETNFTVVPAHQLPSKTIDLDEKHSIWRAPIGCDKHMGEFHIGHSVRVPTVIDEGSGVAFVYDSQNPEHTAHMRHVAEEIRTGHLRQ